MYLSIPTKLSLGGLVGFPSGGFRKKLRDIFISDAQHPEMGKFKNNCIPDFGIYFGEFGGRFGRFKCCRDFSKKLRPHPSTIAVVPGGGLGSYLFSKRFNLKFL